MHRAGLFRNQKAMIFAMRRARLRRRHMLPMGVGFAPARARRFLDWAGRRALVLLLFFAGIRIRWAGSDQKAWAFPA